ncbi:hypothetical protein A3A21_01290 [Candidatus Jorgensenbacteria bacterium RIFCSPLOWO2_01_FULL_45_25b]|uniref:Uncharacterized protein n=1 Tax=Candidatus Jorgensenbacteria bacterium RIFCSPLOWO2_01_FULL_45_25b TaxID=1798471 RepID=A0A1F6BVK0_9BACT|nr:MAG: hypothetical protein A3A21_01290 [Candidatus Jorgensenbacteria bacterium RIFCSPLOWO2_01_FULL_45_25b]
MFLSFVIKFLGLVFLFLFFFTLQISHVFVFGRVQPNFLLILFSFFIVFLSVRGQSVLFVFSLIFFLLLIFFFSRFFFFETALLVFFSFFLFFAQKFFTGTLFADFFLTFLLLFLLFYGASSFSYLSRELFSLYALEFLYDLLLCLLIGFAFFSQEKKRFSGYVSL